MADVTRFPASDPSSRSESDEERQRTIESLLVTGLDLYFAGDCERAIHAWTRVLFFDRTHARARAYIDRARSVLAERQRETDELLHRGLSALDAGDTSHARALLTSAVKRGGAVEAAEMALERAIRLEVASGPNEQTRTAGAVAPPGAAVGAGRRAWASWLLASLAIPLLAVAAALALGWDPFESPGSEATEVVPLLAPVTVNPLPQPLPSELALRRARGLFTRGHLHEALAELERVGADDPHRPEADRLQADMQRALLGEPFVPAPAAAPPPGGR